ncbi:DUF4219 domain-containing protein/UBN2 domain-containing protein [Cephalotus follicularis]|uniref:DUF4219 domain-containing protein/UBN2 domain-containing protein n=1 Tax=Cephalotus follicularis TaxID=3775 RepID=A0A1Q3AMZ3_CEPFO|nr:DUF4219 domain-containing protein/UBN2 domain-containing protein [Cephalotus follicularis]
MSNKESMSISKPPFFDGNNYSHWKAKMTIFIQALDFNLWDIIIDGPELPDIISQEGIKTLKPRSSYTDDDRKKVQLNAKAKHVIICALNSNEFNRVSSCATAKEMWDRLEVTYEGTNQVKDAKINMLVREYEKSRSLHPPPLLYIARVFISKSTNTLCNYNTRKISGVTHRFTLWALVNRINLRVCCLIFEMEDGFSHYHMCLNTRANTGCTLGACTMNWIRVGGTIWIVAILVSVVIPACCGCV